MDADNLQKVKGQMHSFAMGEAMAQAARDYQKDLLAQCGSGPSHGPAQDVEDWLEDDPELERLHAARLEEMRRKAEARAEDRERERYGSVIEIAESEFLPTTTGTASVVVHFFHPAFGRCRVMDRCMEHLAPRFPYTKFVRLSAPDAPFFAEKLRVRMLPCVIMFRQGVAVDRIVGFDGVEKPKSAGEDVSIELVEQRLRAAGVLEGKAKPVGSDDEDASERHMRGSSLRKGLGASKVSSGHVDDEDDDF
ncbi:hypothetical protein H632_c139p1 [Helicosporidium sp. ATCC 50920]|nr:hypothetical protein H632_c139p1 [Helicosporidium sp. ATCC 50920]|eukprot:KDD76684.1 hypothetical protein H632_c139p1 [Helicosporidium sp. ATCC 50920]